MLGVRLLVGLAVFSALGSANISGNASEPIVDPELLSIGEKWASGINEDLPSLGERAAAPVATPLPPGGIAAAIGPNQTHVYSLNLSQARVNYSISLSECARTPLNESALTLTSGRFSGDTSDGGLIQLFNLTQLNNTFTITSPASTNLQALWSYQLGYDDSAAFANPEEGLFWVDSDFANSLFVTQSYENFTGLVLDTPYENFVNKSNLNATTRQFNLFLHQLHKGVEDSNDVTTVLGKSFCAMQESALLNQNNADFSTTDRGNNRSSEVYKGQFLFKGLNTSSDYLMQLGIPPKPGYTGGMLFDPVPFRTKTSMSCQLIYNLSMCPNTAFSVPGNASVYTSDELTALYNGYVERYYANFTQALDQINCNASRQDMFSVFSTCDDCADAYLDWLCTVAVPRCEDWSNNATYLVEREMNQSRNNMINDIIRPGRYKEVLPCYWLCNNLATRCPMSMGFGCPVGKMLNDSYGWNEDTGIVSCSYPGAVYTLDGAWVYQPSWILLIAAVTLVVAM